MKDKFEIESNSNVLFVTNQCNNHCIMCCQPPKKGDDFDFYFKRNVDLVKSAPKEVNTVCITGGEPTLAGRKFLALIELVREQLPNTEIHILSNGRSFINKNLTRQMKEVGGDNFFVGIPLHSDYAPDHDLISGVKGAFNETMLGLYNVADEGIPIELRVVVNKLNYYRLPNISDFIFKNLNFVSWTAFMGMEDTGLARVNANRIWVEPVDYISFLCEAVKILDEWALPVAIYNIPLCLIPSNYHKFASKSISDWKTKYLEICNECSVRELCCGLFGTSKKIYQGLRAIKI